MFKKFAAAVIALGLMATSAVSAEVFNYGVGFWNIKGHVGNGDASCVVSTRFDNGGLININVFPRRDGSQYTTMTVYNPYWAPTPKFMNESFNEALIFVGSRTGTVKLTGQFQVYGSRKVILRSLSDDFSYLFINARDMVVFPGTSDQIVVSLRGTQAVSNALDSCKATVLQY